MAPCSPFLTMQLAIPRRVRRAENGAGCKHIKCCGQEEPVDLASFPGLLSPLWNLSFMCCLLSAVASEPSDPGGPKAQCSCLWSAPTEAQCSCLCSAPTEAQCSCLWSAPTEAQCSYLWSAPTEAQCSY